MKTQKILVNNNKWESIDSIKPKSVNNLFIGKQILIKPKKLNLLSDDCLHFFLLEYLNKRVALMNESNSSLPAILPFYVDSYITRFANDFGNRTYPNKSMLDKMWADVAFDSPIVSINKVSYLTLQSIKQVAKTMTRNDVFQANAAGFNLMIRLLPNDLFLTTAKTADDDVHSNEDIRILRDLFIELLNRKMVDKH